VVAWEFAHADAAASLPGFLDTICIRIRMSGF